MPEEVEYPQVTADQVELWMANPVTRAYLRCLSWKTADTAESAGNGSIVDSSNADLTHAIIHRALGQQDGYKAAHDPEALLEFYNMIFKPEPEPDGDE